MPHLPQAQAAQNHPCSFGSFLGAVGMEPVSTGIGQLAQPEKRLGSIILKTWLPLSASKFTWECSTLVNVCSMWGG